ncbi:MAG: alpha-ketoglutarate-dependent dioxygenase AlkB family protein [Fluviicola sp.]
MNLLFPLQNFNTNLLTKDGEVIYFGVVFQQEEIESLFSKLQNEIEWKHDQALIYGKLITTKRKVAWYANKEFSYTYSKVTKTALLFPQWLIELKEKVENLTQVKYNSCLLNYYSDGGEGMTYHSDAEKELKKNGSIASLSFGAERNFVFKHKTSGEKVSVFLESGSLLEMKGETQTHWLHALPTTKKVNSLRINLTFRQMEQ